MIVFSAPFCVPCSFGLIEDDSRCVQRLDFPVFPVRIEVKLQQDLLNIDELLAAAIS